MVLWVSAGAALWSALMRCDVVAGCAFINKINVNGKDYLLPEPKPDAFSKRVLLALDSIKYGEIQDPHQWMLTI